MIYLLALLGVIGCMLLVDRRFELFLWHRPLAALLAVPYVVNTLRFRRITDATSGAAHRGWQLFLPLNYVTGFLVTLLLIGWALTRGAAA